jgi:hypothetical protein
MKKLKNFILLALIGLSLHTNAQTFTKTFGTSASEIGRNAIRTSEGGYALLVNKGNTFDIIKTDSIGNIQWQNNYAYGTTWGMNSLIQTNDGGYAVVGQTQSSTYTSGKYSVGIVVKFNSTGSYQWHTILAGNSSESGNAGTIAQNINGEYIVSINLQGHPDFGGSNYHPSIVKLSTTGSIVWSHAINNSCGYDYVIVDGLNYYVAGNINGVFGSSNYKGNAFLAKYNDAGSQLWLKNYTYAPVSNGNQDRLHAICRLSTGEFVLAGYTITAGVSRTLIIKADANGNFMWDKFYGDTILFNSISKTSDGNIVATGGSTINGNDLIVYKMSVSNGANIWSSYFGGANSDYGSSIIELSQSNLLVFGTTASFGAGSNDAWLLKLTSNGSLCTTPSQASTPTGTTQLCINPSNSNYTTTGATNATEYVWEISPAGAGTITGTGTTGIVDWNNTYSGNATIRVKGTSGTACVGDFSNGLTVNINPLPIVSLSALNSVCINASSFALSGGTPSGGNYSGNGVSVNTFNPSVAGVGSFPINYTYTDGNLCSNSAIQNITVNPLPIVSINAFPSFVNYYATPYTLTGNPSGGVFSGAGINGLNFNPQSAGLGSKTISYNYSDANNCSNSANISTIVYDTTGVVCTTNDTTFVTITDTIYISVTDTLIIDAILTGLTPPNNMNTLKIYPNPALTHIYIDNGNYTLMNGYSIRINNTLSQTVFSSPINQALIFIDLSTWSGNGLYFVLIIDDLGNTIETRKIIVE